MRRRVGSMARMKRGYLGPERANARVDIGRLVTRSADHRDRTVVGNRRAIAGKSSRVGDRWQEFLLFVQVCEREAGHHYGEEEHRC